MQMLAIPLQLLSAISASKIRHMWDANSNVVFIASFATPLSSVCDPPQLHQTGLVRDP